MSAAIGVEATIVVEVADALTAIDDAVPVRTIGAWTGGM
jgi:hypothetical protein